MQVRKIETRRFLVVGPTGRQHRVTEYAHYSDGSGRPGHAAYTSWVLDTGETLNPGTDAGTLIGMRSGQVLRKLAV